MPEPETTTDGRFYDLLLADLQQIRERVDAIGEEDRSVHRVMASDMSAVRREIAVVREELVTLRVRLSVVWGVASCLGGALVIGAAKLLGALRG